MICPSCACTVPAGHQSRVDGVAQLAERRALREAIDDDEVGPREARGVELLLAGRVGSERGDVLSGAQPLGPHERRRATASP